MGSSGCRFSPWGGCRGRRSRGRFGSYARGTVSRLDRKLCGEVISPEGSSREGRMRTGPDHPWCPASSSPASMTEVPTGRLGVHLRSPVTSSSSRLHGARTSQNVREYGEVRDITYIGSSQGAFGSTTRVGRSVREMSGGIWAKGTHRMARQCQLHPR